MKRTVKLSLGMSFIMMAIALIAPYLASPKLVLRFLPKDVYEAGKDHPAPSLPKQLLCHLLLAMAAVYMVRAYKDVTGGLVEKTFDIVCLDQVLCMSTDYYQRFYPETKGCEGWKDRSWNNKNQAVRLVLYPIFCAVQAYLLTKREK